jgi:HEAT repeat protein
MTNRVGMLAIAGLVVAGGLRGAPPRLCLSPVLCFTGGAPQSQTPAPEAQTPVAPTGAPSPAADANVDSKTITPDALRAAIDQLGAFEYVDRARAARTARRAPQAMAIPALLQASAEHADGYVRYRSLVLLSSYPDPRVRDEMERVLADPNDRVRAAAYEYFEHHPEPSLLPAMLAAFDKELAEFVRPALVRALAAQGKDPNVQKALIRDVTRGQDFFRSTVIEALGDYKATYAVPAISGVAALEGPLQDDAALALGKIGDKRSLAMLVGLQRTAPRENQPLIAAAICLLGTNCDSHRGYLSKVLTFADKTPGYQELLRGAAAGLAALAVSGDRPSLDALYDIGVPAQDPARAPIALALASVAVKQPLTLLESLENRPDRRAAVDLLRDGFDMLEEDFGEETFFAAIRKAYWAAPESGARRQAAQELIQRLDF